VTKVLELEQDEQSYLIFLWLKYARDFTLERTQDGGNLELGISAQLGSKALLKSMQIMEAELPNLLFATYFNEAFNNTQTNCSIFYYNTLNFTKDVAASLCNLYPSVTTLNSTVFNFTDPFLTTYALTNIFYSNDTLGPKGSATTYSRLFQQITGLTWAQMNDTINNSPVVLHFMNNIVIGPVISHYQATLCAGNIGGTCSGR
jgi:hypothetical protein